MRYRRNAKSLEKIGRDDVRSGDLFPNGPMERPDNVLRGMRGKALPQPSYRAPLQRLASTRTLPNPTGVSILCRRCEMQGKSVRLFARSSFLLCGKLTDHQMEEHALECAFCFVKCLNFAELAKHVVTCHKSPEERGDYYHATANPMEDNLSLPQPGGGNARSTADTGTRRGTATVPWIKVEDLRSDPVTAKILAVSTVPNKFNDITVKIAVNGRSYFLGLKSSNENYETLFKAFGDDDTKWVGETFTIGTRFNDFHEKSFVHIFDAPAPQRKSKKD